MYPLICCELVFCYKCSRRSIIRFNIGRVISRKVADMRVSRATARVARTILRINGRSHNIVRATLAVALALCAMLYIRLYNNERTATGKGDAMRDPSTTDHHDDHDHDAHNDHDHHEHGGKGGHGHEHGKVDADLYGNKAGLRAVQISTAGMLLVALIQFAIATIGGSAGLFADALHNLGDVFTTVALWIAFVVSNRAANQRYTYGYYRSEDLAGIFIVLVIIASATGSAVESIQKLISGNIPTHIYLSMAAALVGVVGNELLAQYKISVGKRINSIALTADGQHSRIDGLTSLAAFAGLVGVKLGFPLADPIAGIVITIVILTV